MPHSTDLKSGDVDLNLLVKDGRHFARQNPEGFVEVVDSVTGRVVAALGAFLGDRQPILETRVLPGGNTLLVETTISPTALSKFKETMYHPWIIDIICQRLVETDASALTEICKEPGMPSYTVLMGWRRKYPEIDQQLQRAREDRAERLRDQALKTALANEDFKFPTQAAKLKVDTLQWAAGVDNTKYSPKAKVEATIHAPTQIIVQTGIDRRQIPASIEVTQPQQLVPAAVLEIHDEPARELAHERFAEGKSSED